MPVYRRDGATGAEELLRRPRLPRLGIIRLGYKETRQRRDGTEYTFPRAADHFVLDDAPSVAKIYGDEPTVLEPVFLPLDNEDIIASHYLRMYTQTWGLVCRGDGRTASRQVDPDRLKATGDPVPADKDTKKPMMLTVHCPCPYLETGDCRETLFLYVMLPEVPGAGVFQVSTGSANSIRNLQGSMAMIRAIAGRINNIRLKLSLVPQKVVSFERGGQVTIHVLQLDLAEQMTAYQLARAANNYVLGILPSPDETPPEDVPGIRGLVEEFSDPEAAPVEEWTNRETLTEADFEPPPAEKSKSVPEEAAKPARSQTRRVAPPGDLVLAATSSPEERELLTQRRNSITRVVKAIVPAEQIDNIPATIALWFPGKSRLLHLTIDELQRAETLFKEKYPTK